MVSFIVRVANTPRLLIGWILGTLVVGSALYSLVERVPWGTGLWWAVVTMFTVGYGDESPSTTAGTVVAVFFMITMWLLLGVISPAALAAKLIVNSDAFTDREQEEIKQNQRTSIEQQAQIITLLAEIKQATPLEPQDQAQS